MDWRKGRGRLGPFKPLLGNWKAEASSEMGPLVCRRAFQPMLGDAYVRLDVSWAFSGKAKPYQEFCLFGVRPDKTLGFWSFTIDGKQSQGWLSEAPDIHPEALCFEADMPAGRARQVYWPSESGAGFDWAVESRTKKGWNRFVLHHYEATDS
ncbi:MAG: hypothetical protein H6873_09225 [Hyphomicrobiaceae bacterium]|nr:hypothetical protein [Hyphomicrobiaceae bacterium]